MDRCKQKPTADTSLHSILYLTHTAGNDKYGFTPQQPVKVGTGPESGPYNSRTYLELLRDAKGKPLKYERLGSCCPYPSAHALFGPEALLDKYQVTYVDANGTEQQALIYITFYDYEEPLIPAGFKTISPK
jgi:hypothetical protein